MSATTVQSAALKLGRDSSAQFNRRMPGYNTSPQARSEEPALSNDMMRLVMLVSVIGVVTALVILAIAHLLGNEIAKGGYSDATHIHEIVLGNDVVEIPANTIRFSSQRRSGVSHRVDLYLHWPTMDGYNEALKDVFTSVDGQRNLLFISLEPRSMPLDMAGRIKPIYSKFFEGRAQDIGNGLVRQPLAASSGYIDEDLVIEINSPYPFAARCLRENSSGGEPFCIRDIHLGSDMMVSYRFHSSNLKDWLAIDRALRNKLKSMLVAQQK